MIKLCGITCPQDIEVAVDAGATALGFVCTPSPRQLPIDKAIALCAQVPDSLRVFLVVRSLTEIPPLTLPKRLEIQASFTPGNAFIHHPRFTLPAIGTSGHPLKTIQRVDRRFGYAPVLLVDGPKPGSGVRADWTLVATLAHQRPVILAGGLNPENVADAIHFVRPAGVDVSSGIERHPGKKDHHRMHAFVAAAKAALNYRRHVCL